MNMITKKGNGNILKHCIYVWRMYERLFNKYEWFCGVSTKDNLDIIERCMDKALKQGIITSQDMYDKIYAYLIG